MKTLLVAIAVVLLAQTTGMAFCHHCYAPVAVVPAPYVACYWPAPVVAVAPRIRYYVASPAYYPAPPLTYPAPVYTPTYYAAPVYAAPVWGYPRGY
jgi:hypothetical protein